MSGLCQHVQNCLSPALSPCDETFDVTVEQGPLPKCVIFIAENQEGDQHSRGCVHLFYCYKSWTSEHKNKLLFHIWTSLSPYIVANTWEYNWPYVAARFVEKCESVQQEKIGWSHHSSPRLRMYHQIIKFLCGWMQHNDCVIMQVIASLVRLGICSRQHMQILTFTHSDGCKLMHFL